MNHLKRTICDILLNQVKNSPTNNSIGTIKNNKVSFISFKKYLETIECLTIGLLNRGVKAQSPRDTVCVDWTDDFLGFMLGKLFVDEKFSGDSMKIIDGK